MGFLLGSGAAGYKKAARAFAEGLSRDGFLPGDALTAGLN